MKLTLRTRLLTWWDLNKAPIFTVIVALAAFAVWAWWKASPRRADVFLIEQCRALYAQARTAPDTARIDAIHPFERSRGNTEALYCGALRRSGELR